MDGRAVQFGFVTLAAAAKPLKAAQALQLMVLESLLYSPSD